MDLDDTPDEAKFRAEARAWLEANAIPKGHPDDFSAGLWGAKDDGWYVQQCRDWQRVLYDGGWAGITWPALYGGRGGRPIEQVIFNQEQAQFGVHSGAFLVAIGMVGPTLLAHGSEAQRQRFLPAMLRGEELWCQLFSEPDAGSDLASLATRAERDGRDWVVSGQKLWTSSADRAARGILLARTSSNGTDHHTPAASRPLKQQGITYFLVDMTSSGIELRRLRQMTGEYHFFEVFLDRVRIPADAVVGEVGEGWSVARTTLMSERTSIAGAGGADPAGLMDLARRLGRSYDATIRQAIVDGHIQEQLLRFFRYRLQTALSQGQPPGQEASVMKLAYARYMKHLTETAVAIKGAAGMIRDEADGMWDRRFLHAPSLRIAGGTDQVQANIVGERVLGLPREPAVA